MYPELYLETQQMLLPAMVLGTQQYWPIQDHFLRSLDLSNYEYGKSGLLAPSALMSEKIDSSALLKEIFLIHILLWIS